MYKYSTRWNIYIEIRVFWGILPITQLKHLFWGTEYNNLYN